MSIVSVEHVKKLIELTFHPRLPFLVALPLLISHFGVDWLHVFKSEMKPTKAEVLESIKPYSEQQFIVGDVSVKFLTFMDFSSGLQ